MRPQAMLYREGSGEKSRVNRSGWNGIADEPAALPSIGGAPYVFSAPRRDFMRAMSLRAGSSWSRRGRQRRRSR